MPFDEIHIVHAVQMISRKNDVLVDIPFVEEPTIFAYGVGGAFEPAWALGCLLRGQYFDKSLRKTGGSRSIGARYMPVERCRIELRQDVNLFDFGIDAVADGDVDQTILGAQRHRRFSA